MPVLQVIPQGGNRVPWEKTTVGECGCNWGWDVSSDEAPPAVDEDGLFFGDCLFHANDSVSRWLPDIRLFWVFFRRIARIACFVVDVSQPPVGWVKKGSRRLVFELSVEAPKGTLDLSAWNRFSRWLPKMGCDLRVLFNSATGGWINKAQWKAAF